MLLRLDFSVDTLIYQQIRNEIVRGIAAGELQPGQQLPPIRTLAEDCGVNMMTVSKAYGLLKQEGYLETDRRAGTTVRARKPAALPEQTRAALELAVAEAKAAGASLEELLALCRRAYGERELK